MNVDQMLRSITYKQLRELQLYERLEPFGDRRADWHAASISAMMLNLRRDSTKAPLPFGVEHFLLQFKDPDECNEVAAPAPTTAAVPVAPAPVSQVLAEGQRLKFIARMHYAAHNADRERKQRGRKK